MVQIQLVTGRDRRNESEKEREHRNMLNGNQLYTVSS